MLLTNTTPELRHCWHVVATTDELGDEPLGVLLLGEPWVVVRLDGIVRAFVDRCPHRLAPMSAGAVVPGEHGAELQCGYHGWRFDGDARCTAIPALSADDHIPGRARLVPAFGVAERYGLIWIAPEEPLADLPTFEWYGADGYDSAMTELVRTPVSAAQLVDNFLDAGARFGLGKRDLVANINWFMNVPVGPDGLLGIVDGISAPGLYVDLRAEMDLVAIVSNCPQINNPCNGFNPTPVRMIIAG